MKRIFLISQPRSGSTLLQHVLASHSKIQTSVESWLYLPICFAFKRHEGDADYSDYMAYNNLQNFLSSTNEGSEKLLTRLGQAIDSYFEDNIMSGKCIYFLEKTPRYYHIIEELSKMYPKAKFIFLVRNPLAVLASIINYNFTGKWEQLLTKDRYHDLVTAPRLIDEAMSRSTVDSYYLKYEDYVLNYDELTYDIINWLELEGEDDICEYEGKTSLPGKIGFDRKSIYKHSRPVEDYTDKWRETFSNTQISRIGFDYLNILGAELLQRLGYSFDELHSKLSEVKTGFYFSTVGINTLSKNPSGRSITEIFKYNLSRLIN